MNEDELLSTVREIRDSQQEMIALLTSQRDLIAGQAERSKKSIDESIALQKLALRRQQTITRIAVPGILLCIGAIVYFLLRYF